MKEHCMLLPLTEMAGMPTNLLDQSGCRMARCDFDGTVNADAIRNAKYIKRAVNCYEKLVAACRAALAADEAALAELYKLRPEFQHELPHDVTDQLREAVADTEVAQL